MRVTVTRDTDEDGPPLSLPLAKPVGAVPGSEDEFDGSPDQLPAVGNSANLAEKKIETATEREPAAVGKEEE